MVGSLIQCNNDLLLTDVALLWTNFTAFHPRYKPLSFATILIPTSRPQLRRFRYP